MWWNKRKVKGIKSNPWLLNSKISYMCYCIGYYDCTSIPIYYPNGPNATKTLGVMWQQKKSETKIEMEWCIGDFLIPV